MTRRISLYLVAAALGAAPNAASGQSSAAVWENYDFVPYGTDGGRITTKGFGDTKPSVPNTTAEGRAQNRRVELVKQ